MKINFTELTLFQFTCFALDVFLHLGVLIYFTRTFKIYKINKKYINTHIYFVLFDCKMVLVRRVH